MRGGERYIQTYRQTDIQTLRPSLVWIIVVPVDCDCEWSHLNVFTIRYSDSISIKMKAVNKVIRAQNPALELQINAEFTTMK